MTWLEINAFFFSEKWLKNNADLDAIVSILLHEGNQPVGRTERPKGVVWEQKEGRWEFSKK